MGTDHNAVRSKAGLLVIAFVAGLGLLNPAAASANGASIVINEVDCHGNDWVELFNRSSKFVDISDWILTDKKFSTKNLLHLYKFPAGTSLASHAHLVIQQTGVGVLQLPFGISCAKGGVVRLGQPISPTSITLIDELAVPIVPAHVTFGRAVDGSEKKEFTVPTKRVKNKTALPVALGVQSKVCPKHRTCIISLRTTQTTKFQLVKKQSGVSITSTGKLTIAASQLGTKTYQIKLINTFGSRVIKFRVTSK
ncbi:MAG: lamin tail domain-containing protein [Actinobacteria bacterium]|nr:lamin tail domain-containing protein [Actinomycetota bacterium]